MKGRTEPYLRSHVVSTITRMSLAISSIVPETQAPVFLSIGASCLGPPLVEGVQLVRGLIRTKPMNDLGADIWLGSTGNERNPMFNGRRQPSCGGTSRMTRECQVRICERLGVKFPGPMECALDGGQFSSGVFDRLLGVAILVLRGAQIA